MKREENTFCFMDKRVPFKLKKKSITRCLIVKRLAKVKFRIKNIKQKIKNNESCSKGTLQ